MIERFMFGLGALFILISFAMVGHATHELEHLDQLSVQHQVDAYSTGYKNAYMEWCRRTTPDHSELVTQTYMDMCRDQLHRENATATEQYSQGLHSIFDQ